MELTQKNIIEILPTFKRGNSYRKYYILKCLTCSGEFKIRSDYIKAKEYCICKKCSKIKSSTTHGKSLSIDGKRDRIYGIWGSMRNRCKSDEKDKYPYYKEKGIKVCKEWDDFMAFHDWALTHGYSDNLSIDRIDGDKNYSPENCRWVTKSIQSQNTKRLRKNNTSGYKGVIFKKDRGRYYARIQVDNSSIHIGISDSAIECAIMYNNYIDKYNLQHTKNIIGSTK